MPVIIIIMDLLKVLQLPAVYNPLWTNTIDWSYFIHISFTELFHHNELLIFKMVLDLITTFGMILQQDQITLWDGQFHSSCSTLFCTFLNALQIMLISSLHQLLMFLQPRALGYRLIWIIVVQAQPCVQTSTDMATIQWLNWVLHCKWKLINFNVQDNWVFVT